MEVQMPGLAAERRPPRVLPGYRFNPAPEELVVNYLEPWIKGESLGERAAVVCVADVYGCHPAELTERFREFSHDGSCWYFLCVARWKASTTPRGSAVRGRTPVMSRVVEGGGCWHSSQRKPVGGKLAGRQTFEFREAGNGKTKWLMEEFSSGMKEARDDTGVKVICKVYLSPRGQQQQPAAAAADEPNAIVGAKRPALLLPNASSPAPVDEESQDTMLAGDPVAPTPVTAKENHQETNVVLNGFKKPRQLQLENVAPVARPSYAAPTAAAPVARPSYAAPMAATPEARRSYAAPTAAAALQQMLENMGRPPVVGNDNRVFISQQITVGYHPSFFMNQQTAHFAQTAADGAATTARNEEAATPKERIDCD